MAKGAFIGVPTKKDALKFLEYIESSGTQYIDTGFQPNQDTKVVMDVQSVGVNNADTGQSFFGARNGSSYRFFTFWHRTNAAYYLYYNNTNTSVASDRLTDRMIVTMDKNALYVGDSVTVSLNYATFECEQNMYLFATNLDGTADYFGVNRVYSCQIYDNGTLVRDFVPCENESGEIGLYDKLIGRFYPNAGTGTFTAGSIVEEIGGETVEVAREVKKIFIGVNGVAREVKAAWVGVNGVARLFFGGLGMPLSDLPVGALVQTNVNGVAKNFIVVHQGLPSSKYDSSCDGIWLLMQEIYTKRVWEADRVANYASSDIHTYLNNTFIGLLDSSMQSAVKQVKIPYYKGTSPNGSSASGSNGLSTKAFLLSAAEVDSLEEVDISGEGAALSYFDGAANSKRKAYYNGSVTSWFLRCVDLGSSTYAIVVGTSGAATTGYTTDSTFGIRPAFILPFDVLVNPTPNADGSYTLLV